MRFTSPLPSREGRTVFAFGVAQPAGTRIYGIALHRFAPVPHFLQSAQRVTFSRDGAWVAWTGPQEQLWPARSKVGNVPAHQLGEDGFCLPLSLDHRSFVRIRIDAM
jgi:hypothetical protein